MEIRHIISFHCFRIRSKQLNHCQRSLADRETELVRTRMELLRLQCDSDAAAAEAAASYPNSASWTSSSMLSARRTAALEKEVEHLTYQLDQVYSVTFLY